MTEQNCKKKKRKKGKRKKERERAEKIETTGKERGGTKTKKKKNEREKKKIFIGRSVKRERGFAFDAEKRVKTTGAECIFAKAKPSFIARMRSYGPFKYH